MDQAGCADRVLQQAAENAPTAWTAGRKTESSSPRAPRGLARAIAPLCGAPSRAGGGKRGSRFLFPPGEMTALSPFQWQGPSPLPQRCAGIRTGRGPKPPASARPAPGGRFAPAGSGAGLCVSRTCRSTGDRPTGAGETRVAVPVPARMGVSALTVPLAGAIASATALRRDQDRPGAQSPRPAPAPPPAGASRPPGRALASAGPRPAGLQGTVPSGRRKRGSRFLFPPRRTTAPPRFNGRGHRPCHSEAPLSGPAGGPKPPASARPALGGRFSPPGRALASVLPGPADLQGNVPRGRGKRGSRFLFPPGTAKAPSTRQWQGPSPLPPCYADIRTSRGPKPPASARPAPGGRFAPAGSGAGLCFSRTCRSAGHRPARAGETRVAFPVPARTGEGTGPASMAGAIAPATVPRRDQDRPGAQSPRPAPIPPPAGASHPPGRALASVLPGPTGLWATVPRGRGNAGRVSCSRPER